ncbi:hypothetical protein [Ornithinimicrobium sp. Y1694]|uniref:hypothetical protein n=1 Tax=Ornithinimicrobium sp. Y1694 TaxID=3418590 RepID=UPI003CF3E1EB
MVDLPEDLDADSALSAAVDALYAVEPAEFIASRKAWVTELRGAGLREIAKEVGAMRRPSLAAATVNSLVRAGDPVVERLREVGERLRHAQSAMDAAGLAALRGERDAVLADWVAAAGEHGPGGGDEGARGALSGAVASEVRDTAIAALADGAATEVVLSGSLTRALSYSGFGEVDVADAVARTSTGVVLTRIEGGGEAIDQRQDDDELGDDALDDDEDERDELEDDQRDEVEDDQHDEREDPHPGPDLDLLERELDEAEKGVAAYRAARKQAADAVTAAERAVEVARAQVAQAERLLAAAQQHLGDAEAGQESAAAELAAADEDLGAAREARDAARAALEEAEDS